TADEPEQEIAGDSRERDFLREPADQRGRHERDADGECGGAKRGFGRRRLAEHPRERQREQQRGETRHQAASGGATNPDNSSNTSAPAATADTTARPSDGAICCRFSAIAIPMTPGDTRNAPSASPAS